MTTVTLARHAMATRFEIVLVGDDPVSLRAAGEEALDEIERLESHLSLYRPSSDVARINRHAAEQPVRIDSNLFRLLQTAKQLSEATDGAFDVTVAPLLRCWGFVGGTGKRPKADELASARRVVGASGLELDEADSTVRFAKSGMMLDLGSIGKGYALDRAVEVLREAGVVNALIHGGTSTVCALGKTAEGTLWKVAVESPPAAASGETKPQPQRAPGCVAVAVKPRLIPPKLAGASQSRLRDSGVAVVELDDESLSVSAVWGKAFTADGRTFGHVIDPRLGEPVQRALLAAVVLPSATESDALSTALLVLGPAGLDVVERQRAASRALVAWQDDATGQARAAARGIALDPSSPS